MSYGELFALLSESWHAVAHAAIKTSRRVVYDSQAGSLRAHAQTRQKRRMQPGMTVFTPR